MCFDIGSQHVGCRGQNTSRIQNKEVDATLCLQAPVDSESDDDWVDWAITAEASLQYAGVSLQQIAQATAAESNRTSGAEGYLQVSRAVAELQQTVGSADGYVHNVTTHSAVEAVCATPGELHPYQSHADDDGSSKGGIRRSNRQGSILIGFGDGPGSTEI